MAIDQRLVWGGIAVGGAGIAVYMYRKNKKQQAQSQAATQSGYGYGIGASGYGYGLTYSPYGYGYGPFGLGAYGGSGDYGYGYYGAGSGTVPAPVPQTASTNAQWSEAAVSALTAVGYDGQAVLAALGVYLTGGNLTQDQAGIISAAIAAEGYPPVASPSGFPPQMHVGGGGGGSGQGSGGGTTGGGGSGGGARMAGQITGLSGSSTRNSITATWARSFAPDGYEVIVRDLSSHTEVAHQSVNTPRYTARGLKSGTDYNVGVQGLPGGPGANVHIRTK